MQNLFEKIRFRIVKSKMTRKMESRMLRGILSSSLREIDLSDPHTWEFSCFSQNGEDGIIDVLTRRIIKPNKYFIEIGAHDGMENCSSYLSLVRNYSGIMVEGNATLSRDSKILMAGVNWGVDSVQMFITLNNIDQLLSKLLHTDPDLFIMDIDGNDYYLVKHILDSKVRPAIFVVEYNSTFGPKQKLTIKYDKEFVYWNAHPSQLYYGASISAWKDLFGIHNYQFIGVDSNGVNAFFVEKSKFDNDFLEGVRACEYKENFYELQKFKIPNNERFELIKDMPLIETSLN